MTAGGQELKRRSAARSRPGADRTGTGAGEGRDRPASDAARTARRSTTRLRTIPYPEDGRPAATPTAAPSTTTYPPAAAAPVAPTAPAGGAAPAPTAPTTAPTAVRPPVDAHVPDVASLAIPGFDILSASQVVQRLDGLSRSELVAVRAYETSTRGRRTILSRVDQLLDERS